MIDDNTLIVVRNRNNGTTGYTLSDSNVRRVFNFGESKKIPFAELRSLQYSPGGAYILDNLLVVENKEALELLNMKVEPEYFYTEAKIKDMLYNATMDEFLDFLDFATEGAIDIARSLAVKEEIPDMRKREALSNRTGFNINNAIMVNKALEEADEKEEEEQPKERRVKPAEEKPAGRRAAVPASAKEEPVEAKNKYKVVETKK